MFFVFGLLLLLIGGFLYFPLLFPVLNILPFNSLFIFLENIFAMSIWIIFFLLWVDYYLDVWIVTNLRIVNIEQKGLFSRTVSELELSRIQDVTTEVLGMIPTFLNYGDVFIQTAAEQERFLFRQVPDPYGIKDQIMKLQKQRSVAKTEEFRKIMDGENL